MSAAGHKPRPRKRQKLSNGFALKRGPVSAFKAFPVPHERVQMKVRATERNHYPSYKPLSTPPDSLPLPPYNPLYTQAPHSSTQASFQFNNFSSQPAHGDSMDRLPAFLLGSALSSSSSINGCAIPPSKNTHALGAPLPPPSAALTLAAFNGTASVPPVQDPMATSYAHAQPKLTTNSIIEGALVCVVCVVCSALLLQS
jgi:hypothetical protein